MISPRLAAQAVNILHEDAPRVIDEINAFTFQTFRTRGGRLGSGMGSLLEAMWVYYMNNILQNQGGLARDCELGWLQDHEPADFACLLRNAEWDSATRQGELFRIEAKSMNIGVDEAKGHFTNLSRETSEHDQLLVLIWSWTSSGGMYFWPQIHDYFLGNALPIIRLRDDLHLARGGTFVQAGACPDGCLIPDCTHAGEPLNAKGNRERRSGPVVCKPKNLDCAANFGGLVRMLKTDNSEARYIFRRLRSSNHVMHEYISFIHKHFRSEEINQYLKAEWQDFLSRSMPSTRNVSPEEANLLLRENVANYQDGLRDYFSPT